MVGEPKPRRSHLPLVVAFVLIAVSIVGLGTGFFIGWAGSGSTPPDAAQPGPTSAPPAGPSSPSPSESGPKKPRGRADSEIERGRQEDLGYVVGARQEPDGLHLTFDRALVYFGDDARREARIRGLRDQLENGRLLVNENPLTRDLVVAEGVRIIGRERLAGQSQPRRVGLRAFLDAVGSDGRQLLLDLRYDRLAYVVEIRESDLAD